MSLMLAPRRCWRCRGGAAGPTWDPHVVSCRRRACRVSSATNQDTTAVPSLQSNRALISASGLPLRIVQKVGYETQMWPACGRLATFGQRPIGSDGCSTLRSSRVCPHCIHARPLTGDGATCDRPRPTQQIMGRLQPPWTRLVWKCALDACLFSRHHTAHVHVGPSRRSVRGDEARGLGTNGCESRIFGCRRAGELLRGACR